MAHATLRDTPTSTWSADAAVMPNTTPVFAYGAVIYADSDSQQLQAIDFQTGAALWTASQTVPDALTTPALVGGVLFLATAGGLLYAISPVTGNLLWTGAGCVDLSSQPLTAPVPGVGYIAHTGQLGPVVYLMDETNLYAVPTSSADGSPPTPLTVYSQTAGALGTSVAYDGSSGNMIVNTSSGLLALQANVSTPDPWGVAWTADLGGYVTSASLAMGKAFVGTSAQTLALVDIASGESLASDPLGSMIEQPISVDVPNNVAYVPTDSGTIFQLDATRATRTGDFQPGGEITTPIVQSDGVAYYGSADKNVYAFDLSAPGTIVSHSAAGPVEYLAGVSSGSAYFGTGEAVSASRFADLIHQFNSQSQLMADFVDAQPPASYQQSPAYRSHVVLYDPEGNVRPNESVKVWANSPATLMTDNQSFQIDAGTPACFQSDASGHVVLSVQADTNIQAGVPSGLSTPALTLWASFMDPDERILIFPDQRLHASLQSITGTQLQSATTYDDDVGQVGPPLLPTGFQGTQGLSNADALASAINNTISVQPPASPVAQDAPPPYLAYPETMLGVAYAATPPDTTRPALPGAVANWSLNLLGPGGVATFTAHANAEEAAHVAAALHDAHLAAGPAAGLFHDIGHFVDNVIHGAERIVTTVWTATESAVEAAISTAENSVYQFAVETIEDAAHVVLGVLISVFDEVENAVEKVIQALSFLFEWQDILVTHEHVKALINDGFGQITTMIDNVAADAGAFFDGLATTITSDFGNVISSLADQGSLGDAAGSTDPNQAYTTDGSDNHSVQGNWMFHKTMTNAIGTNGQVVIGSPPAAISATNASDPVAVVAEAMLAFLEDVAKDSLTIAEDLGDDVAQAARELMQTLLDPSGAQGAQLADLLTRLEQLLLDLVALAKDATADFFTLLHTVVEAIQAMLNASIDIPFVSWLYKEISGDDLSILDLFALIVAVPITVMSKALTGAAPFPSGDADAASAQAHRARLVQRPDATPAAQPKTLNIQNMIWTFNGLIYVFLDCFSNALGDESPPLLSYGQALTGTISQGVTVPYDATGDQARDWGLLWLYGCFPPVWNAHSAMQASSGSSTSNVVLPVWGVGSAIWQGVYAGMYPAEFFDDGIKLVQNEVGCLSTIAGVAKESDNPDVLTVLVVVDFFLDMANAMIEIKYWWD